MRWTLLFLLSCGGSSPPPQTVVVPSPSASAPAPTTSVEHGPAPSREAALIAKMLKRVSRARGIDAAKPIPGKVLSREQLMARVKDHVAKEIPPQAIRDEGLVLQIMGFIPTAFDYEAAEYALLEQQLAGYYEPGDGTMYMAADLPEEEADATLAHELVHALQDLKWDLKSRSKYRPGEGDKSSAVSALAEGDATSAMFDVMIAKEARGKTALDLPDEFFAEQIRNGMSTGPTASSPKIMRNALASPYIYGTLFVNALRRKGGWPLVNKAWDNAPTSSEQILHVDKWEAHEAPIAVETPKPPGTGWTVADSDTYGELGARLTFEEWVSVPIAARAASGWGGDRGALYKNGDLISFAWRVVYDDPSAASTSFELVLPGFEKQGQKVGTKDKSFVCVERPDRGPMAMFRGPKDLVVVAGATKVAGTTWKSSGTCAQLKTWAQEIVK